MNQFPNPRQPNQPPVAITDYNPNRNIRSYEWDFGDATTENGNHVFRAIQSKRRQNNP